MKQLSLVDSIYQWLICNWSRMYEKVVDSTISVRCILSAGWLRYPAERYNDCPYLKPAVTIQIDICAPSPGRYLLKYVRWCTIPEVLSGNSTRLVSAIDSIVSHQFRSCSGIISPLATSLPYYTGPPPSLAGFAHPKDCSGHLVE